MTERERIALDEEAQSLPIHVKMCAMRHTQILARVEEADAKISARIDQADADAKAWRGRIEKSVWALIAMVSTAIGGAAVEFIPVMRALAGQ